ncbi:MAG: amino acid adenylation domain-containing protein, partial [Prolixibacteraceae bacterium]
MKGPEKNQNIMHVDSIANLFPLSAGQKRLWFIDQFELESTAYNLPYDYRISGEIDPSILEQSIEILLKRHESLRTIFPSSEGIPFQKITDLPHFTLDVVNLEKFTEKDQAAEIEKHSMVNELHQFDLEKGPLYLFKLMKLSSKDWILLFNFHHIVSDGWSVKIFLEELGITYTALMEQKPYNLPVLPVSYSDYSIWENDWLMGEKSKKQSEYWKNELKGVPELLQLPMDYHRPNQKTSDGEEFSLLIGKEITGKLRVFSQQNEVTELMSLLSVFNTLITRYCAEDDFVVGIPIATRRHEELQGLTGILLNNLPIRITTHENMSFLEMLELSKKKYLQAFDNQEFPIEMILEEQKVSRHANINPLIQVLFNYMSHFHEEISLQHAKMRFIDRRRSISQFDLSLHVDETEHNFNCVFEYNSNLFKRERIERMAGHFLELLKNILENPHEKINKIPILSEAENDLMLTKWNSTIAEFHQDKCVHQLFEEQVDLHPESIAVVDDYGEFSYKDLNDRANLLANYLVKLGAAEDQIVSVYVERGIQMIVAILAISKTGATYLPLDPIYPKDRIAMILNDAQPIISITQKSLSGQISENTGKIVLIDESSLYANESSENLHLGNPDKPLYIIYTSGSTGKPKGVPIKQNSVVNLVNSMNKLLRITSEDILLSVTTITFDIAVMDIFGPFLKGAKIVIASQETMADMELLIRKFTTSKATVFEATPVTYRMLVLNSWPGNPNIRLVCGGEALSKELVRELQARSKEIWNVYAPTETTIFSVVKKLSKEDSAGDGYVPLGRPIDNTLLYVLNKDLVPVPVGVPGELFIGGVGLSPGYLNMPEITRDRFINNPFPNEQKSKIYKTGDVVRYLDNGDVLFMNRIDNQVKIRGFRIELGEIESALALYETIKNNVVMVREDSRKEKNLIAYIVQKENTTTDLADLRNFLKTKVPDYMVPASFLFLDQFPLTQTGKIDRKSLPEPDDNLNQSAKIYIEPTNEIEKELTVIWSESLNISKIGIGDNFFELGGNSLYATIIISRINKNFNIHLPLRSIFEKQNLADLATEIQFHLSNVKDSENQIIPHLDTTSDTFPLSAGQKRLWFVENLEPGNLGYNVPLSYHIKGEIDPKILEESISALIRRHDTLRTIILTVDGTPVQKILPSFSFQLDMVHLENLPSNEKYNQLEKYIHQNEQHLFDLEKWPLSIFKLLRLSADEYTLLMNFHHIITDGTSVRIFVEDLGQIYTAIKENRPTDLPELPITYGDYASWQEKWMESDTCRKQIDFWTNELKGAPELLQLPLDFPRPKIQTYDGDEVNFVLDAALTQQLQLFSKRTNTTLFVTLLSLFNSLITRYISQDEFMIGIPIAGRNFKELELLHGMLINNLLMRVSPTDDMSFPEMVELCKLKFFQDFENQEVPFDKIIEIMKVARHPNISPLFQVMFNFLNMFDEEISLADAIMEKEDRRGNVAQFDLTLHVYESKKTLNCVFEYNVNLFKRDRIKRMAEHFQELVKSLMKHPDQKIRKIPILSLQEKRLVLKEWNTTKTCFQDDKCIHQLFEEQVIKSPLLIAIQDDHHQITYRELNEKANQLARYIHQSGAVEGSLIAICADRTTDLLVALLAVMKSGCTYIPLDPIYPKDRLAL